MTRAGASFTLAHVIQHEAIAFAFALTFGIAMAAVAASVVAGRTVHPRWIVM